MSWEDQGRRYHMWFGHGTAPGEGKGSRSDPSVTGKSMEERVLALAYGAIATLPAAQRRQAEGQYHDGALVSLKEAMTAWMRGARLSPSTFAARFFGRGADDPVVRSLHGAVRGAAAATSHEDIREAAGRVADAIKAVGVSQWPRFVADAAERALNPAAVAAADRSGQPAMERMQSAEDRLDKTAPVPFLDRAGQAILNNKGEPMMRPAGLPPEMFVSRGLQDKEIEKVLIASASGAGGAAELAYQATVLANFQRGGPWDAQRLGGSFHQEFVDYATVAIGLYAAANGMTRREILNIQDWVARGSRYASGKEMDSVYTHLPKDNIKNTDLGYSLYQSGRIGVTAP